MDLLIDGFLGVRFMALKFENEHLDRKCIVNEEDAHREVTHGLTRRLAKFPIFWRVTWRLKVTISKRRQENRW